MAVYSVGHNYKETSISSDDELGKTSCLILVNWSFCAGY
jgi:hypothetical protein